MLICSVCGAEENLHWYKEKVTKLLKKRMCFDCDYWDEMTSIKDDSVRIEGRHYLICDENEEVQGYGGQRFRIRFLDGRIVETTNLWSQGTIPLRFRNQLPNNAEFIPMEND